MKFNYWEEEDMHVNENKLKAYLDGELDDVEREWVKDHLESCKGCRVHADEQNASSETVRILLDTLAPHPSEAPLSVSKARHRFELYASRKEKDTMFNKLFTRKLRPLWVGVGLVLILAISLAFPSVRAIANDFLGLFRVQQFTVVQVNPGDLPEQLGASAQLEAMISRDVQVETFGDPKKVTNIEEAESVVGMTVRLPTAIGGELDLRVSPAGRITFSVDMEHVQMLLEDIGRPDIQLPPGLDGVVVTVDIPKTVTAMYGECEYDPEIIVEEGYDPDARDTPQLPRCTTLVQVSHPTVDAPPGLDVAKIGEAFLQVLGMGSQEATTFSQNIDWTTTLVVPIPMYGTSYREVSIDGVTGTLILQRMENVPDQYMLMWVKDDIIYALTGPGSVNTALSIAESIK
jgi:hypothetical protein